MKVRELIAQLQYDTDLEADVFIDCGDHLRFIVAIETGRNDRGPFAALVAP